MEKRSRITPYFLAIISIIFFALAGCNDDFFDQKAGDRITPDKHYQTVKDAEISMQGALVPLQEAMPKLIMLDGLRSDMMDVTANSNAYLSAINNQMFSNENPYTDPSDLYKVIINVNEILANIDSIANRDRNYDQLTAFAYKGALIGLRSWTYLTLVRLYNKAAYIADNLTSLPETLNQNVLDKETLIDLLISQITPYIQDNTTGTQYEELRIEHYMNTKALLGELYLEIGNYSEAARYLKLACESYTNDRSILKVDNSYKDLAWGAIFLNSESNTVENISVIPFSREDDQYNPLPNWMIYQYLVKPSEVLVDSFISQISADGLQGDFYRGVFTIGGVNWEADSIVTDNTTYITKYFIDGNNPFSSDIIISRAADIHLLLAEAYNRMEDEESQNYALMLLNQGVNGTNPKPAPFSRWSGNLGIRGRAYLQSREVPERDSIPLYDRTLLIEDNIIAERSLELAFEGKRWFDLVRIAERRNDPQFLADKVAAKFEGTSKYDEIHAKLMNPANWYLPFN